jgi:hypothetical protein
MVSDRGGRWTVGLNKQYPREGWPEYAEWLPEPGGIVYSDQMTVFYDLFFRNPRAPWRYVLGFEPTFMTEDNLAVYRQIQLNQRAAQSFEPWVRAMRPEDRMILQGGPSWKPDIRGLEWGYPVKGYWMGRLPRATPAAASDPEAPGLPD